MIKTIRNFIILTFFIIPILIGLIIFNIIKIFSDDSVSENPIKNVIETTIPIFDNSELEKEKFNECMKSNVDVFLYNENLEKEREAILTSLADYKVSIYYENITDNDIFIYNEKKIYYSASLVKLMAALYIYDMASNNSINLDTELKYEAKYQLTDSVEMKKRKVGSMVSLRNLVEYAVSVSDNTAYAMLFDYVGLDKLNDYSKTLGIKSSLFSQNRFGNLSAEDANILLKEVYNFIETNPELGKELKEYMQNDYYNILSLDIEFSVAHKYGHYDSYFHDIGIIYEEYPYTLAFFTHHGRNEEYQEIIKKLHLAISNYHRNYIGTKASYCVQESKR